MGWKFANGTHFSYAASQEPHFKFNSFLLFLNAFGLIEYNNVTETYTNTDYANKLEPVHTKIASMIMAK